VNAEMRDLLWSEQKQKKVSNTWCCAQWKLWTVVVSFPLVFVMNSMFVLICVKGIKYLLCMSKR